MGAVFVVLVVVLLALGAGFWFLRKPEVPAGAGQPVKGTLHLETFVLNLADPGQRSYLRVGIDLGLGRDLDRDPGKEENAAPIGLVRDTIVGVLAQSKVEDLLTAQGKEKLKADLLQALQERMPVLEVKQVYFTEFLIQR
jgi:flagellar protein FliL